MGVCARERVNSVVLCACSVCAVALGSYLSQNRGFERETACSVMHLQVVSRSRLYGKGMG